MIEERTVDLWQYLPDFLKQFRELNTLFEAERPQFQALVHNELSLLNNLFIDTATNEGLKRFEQILHLYPDPTDTLEIRRSNIMSAWFSDKTYTLKTLLNRLSTLQGNDNIQLEWDEDDAYLLHVTTRLEIKGQVDRLHEILEEMFPADIAYQSTNYIEATKEVGVYYAAGLSVTGTLFLTNDFTGTVEISGNAFVGMANGYTEIISTN